MSSGGCSCYWSSCSETWFIYIFRASELHATQETWWRFGEQALSNLLWSGFICRSMWIKPLHAGRLAPTATAFTFQMTPPGCIADMGKPQIGGNKSCEEHMEGKMRDVKRGESTWKQMKRCAAIPQSLQWRQHDVSLIWRFNGEPEAARGRCIESTAESGRERETKTVIECRRETGQQPNQKDRNNQETPTDSFSSKNQLVWM